MKPFDTLIFIMDIPQRSDLLRKLRNYLIFLKDYGYSEIPMELTPSSLNGFNENKLSHSSVETSQKEAMNNQKLVRTKSILSIEDVQKELGECTRCKLHNHRKSIVFGSGNPNADLVFVGEGPGADEDEQGFPFVGRAGKKLTEIIEKGMKLNRDKDTYICNIVKCRPPSNRDPESDEIASCKPFLIKQIQAIRPKAIVALGKPAASTLLGRTVPIMKERGNWHKYEGIPLMLTLHPAYLMRAYTLENRRNVMNDMNKVLKLLYK
jgi:uracil-DNA glycosylase